MYFFNGPYALTVHPRLHPQLSPWQGRSVRLRGTIDTNEFGWPTQLIDADEIQEVRPLEHPCDISVHDLELDPHGTLGFSVRLEFPSRSKLWPDGSTFITTDDIRLIIVSTATGEVIVQRMSPTRGRYTRQIPANGAIEIKGSYQMADTRRGLPKCTYQVFVNLGNVNFSGTPCERGPDEKLVVTTGITPDDALVPYMSRMGISKRLSLSAGMTEAALLHAAQRRPDIEDLSIGVSQVTGGGLRQMKRFAGLKRLAINGFQLDAAGIDQLVALPTLPHLTVTDPGLDDDKLAGLKRLRNFNSLSLSSVNVTDKGIASVAGVPNLQNLVLSYLPNVTDIGMTYLARCRHLQSLSLGKCAVTTAGIEILKRRLPACRIEFRHNYEVKAAQSVVD